VFKDETFVTPAQFQTGLRIHDAHRLICAGASPRDAGRQVGYASPQTFMHAYVEAFDGA
jgi:AraC-like DNA-binding protein